MKIELTTEQEVADYIRYLYDTDTLMSELGNITLEGEGASTYFSYRLNNKDDNSSTGKTKDYVKWTKQEDSKFRDMLDKSFSPKDIAVALNRGEGSIRSRANKICGMGYRNGEWQTLS